MKDRVTKAVILARGLGKRMREKSEASLDAQQSAIADLGVKAMIPIGRPFLDYVLSGLADASFRDVCLVIGPEHSLIRDYYTRSVKPERLAIHFAIQEEPQGTADAVAAAEEFVGDELFLVINSDNYYPVEALRALRELSGPGLAAFSRVALIRLGNVTEEKVAKYALLRVDDVGYLTEIIEKPSDDVLSEFGDDALVSMTSWIFSREIFQACRSISRSVRGEFELPDAVTYAIRNLGERFRVLKFEDAVLDLSRRSDIEFVAARLASVEVRL
jgi:glucose-1-phosphate thymidylyltransferase